MTLTRRHLIGGAAAIAAMKSKPVKSWTHGNTFAAQTNAFLARVAAQTAAQQARYNTLITSLISAGVWSALDALWLTGNVSDATTAKQNLVSANYTLVAHGTIPFSSSGFTGDGSTGYLDTTFVPSASTGNYKQNSASVGVYSNSNVAWAAGDTTNNVQYYMASNATCYMGINDATPFEPLSTSIAGLWTITRLNGSTNSGYLNDLLLGSKSSPSTSLDSSSILIGAVNGSPPYSYSTAQFSAAFIGGGLTSAQVASLYEAIYTFLNGIGTGATITLSADFAQAGEGYYAGFNSTWNKGSLVNGVDFTQTIQIDADAGIFPSSVPIVWSWPGTPASGNVYGFPCIMYGTYDAANSLAAPYSPTAKKCNAITTLTFAHNTSISGTTAQFSVLYDGYLTTTADGATKSFEVQVLVHTPSYVSTYINGLPTKYTYTDASSNVWTVGYGSAFTPPIITFMPQAAGDILIDTIDFKAMLAFLITNSVITGNEYFNGIALGVEARELSGGMTVNSISVTYN